MVAPKIQKDIVHCFAMEILDSILEEIGNDIFCLLVDASRDVSGKEQMAVVLRYVDKYGIVKERFVGLVHVKETTSAALKSYIGALFVKYNLSLKQLRGQGYDGASNMRGEFNGLQSLILRENNSAYYVHCFAHKLQLVVVAVVRKHTGIGNFFDMISVLLNVVGASSKRKDMIRDINQELVHKALGCGQLKTGTGLNQELSLQRPGDTRWSSHYKTLKSLVDLFPIVIKVLEYVEKEDRDDKKQKKDQDIVNAIACVNSTKSLLGELRRHGWQSMLGEAYAFCDKHDLSKLEMGDDYVNPKKPRQKTGITNQHHYEVDCFNDVLDWLLQELNSRFNEKTSKLLVYTAALSPKGSFREFNLENLMSLAKLYPNDFDDGEVRDLQHHLRLYIADVRADVRFSHIETIGVLSQKMVETRKHICYPLVYRLLKLVLVLPVATATVERCFLAMKIVKSYLRNRIGDEYLSESLICYVEKRELERVTNDIVINRFQNYRKRRVGD
uniref:HAT C-terminal dimerisation domain-containing protein n=1 Tax=Arundo donax TaxID=35708 RepID=A0A0A9GZJ4_ARUDO